MSNCLAVRRIDIDSGAYTHCILQEGHLQGHFGTTGLPWYEADWPPPLSGEREWKRVMALHKAKTGADDTGDYVICDYDKTPWPCLTMEILRGHE